MNAHGISTLLIFEKKLNFKFRAKGNSRTRRTDDDVSLLLNCARGFTI